MTITASLIAILAIGGPLSSGSTPTANSGWAPFQSKDGSFKVEFPAPPQDVSREEKIMGLNLTLKGEASYTSQGGFLVLFTDFPKNSKAQSTAKAMFAGAAVQIQESGKLKLVQSTEFEFGKYPARMLVLEGPNGFMIKDFLIVAKDRFYQVMTATTGANLKDPSIDRFFNSFALR